MNEKATRIVNALRVECGERTCTACPCDDWCSGREVNCLENDAADLIESLSAQLDQVTRERDAAVEDLKYVGKIDGTFCEICKHQPEEDCEKRKFENMDCFEWRGVEKEVEG